MSEARMWQYLKPKLEEVAKVVRISDRHIKGFPDLIVARLPDKVGEPCDIDDFDRGVRIVPGKHRQTGLIEMKYVPEGKKKCGLRPDQSIFVWNWAKAGYAGVVVRDYENSWYYLQPQPAPAWIDLSISKTWRTLITSYWTKDHPQMLADWLLSNLFDV